MKSFVITILENARSVDYAKRCMKSGVTHGGMSIKHFWAITPESQPFTLAESYGIPLKNFHEVYSRYDRVVSAFMSHFLLWKKCVELKENICIFEHDAVIINNINPQLAFDRVINLGAPSYGKFNTPKTLGAGPLISKRYFPGAHAYMLSPRGAQALIDKAKTHAAPTDVFLNLDNFPFLQEHYPWLAKADDNFSTIQNKNGCVAKHNWGETYELI